MNKLKFIIISYYSFPYNAISALRISHFSNFMAQKNHKIYFVKADNKYYRNLIDAKLKLDDKIEQISIAIKPTNNPSLSRVRFTLKIAEKIKKIIKKEKIDFLFFCSDPFWYLPLGPIFKIFYNIPYIIDFRDIMYRHPIFDLHKYNKFSDMISDKFLESLYIKYSKFIIDVTDENTDFHRKIYKNQPENKFITIANSYDSKLINNFNKSNTILNNILNNESLNDEILKRKLKLAISGKFAFYGLEDVDLLLKLENINIELAKKIEIIAIGRDNPIFKEKAKNARFLTFTFHNQMSQLDAFNILKDSDILLLNNNQKTALGTKIFDYIGLNKPIFAFVEKDYAIWKLLQKFENAFIIQNEDDLVKALNEVLNKNIRYLTKNEDLINNYSRDNQYAKLEKILIENFSNFTNK